MLRSLKILQNVNGKLRCNANRDTAQTRGDHDPNTTEKQNNATHNSTTNTNINSGMLFFESKLKEKQFSMSKSDPA